MKVGLSLFARLLLWFFATVMAIGLVLLALFKLQFLLPPDSALRVDTGPRLMAVGQHISGELSRTPEAEWDGVLEGFSRRHEVKFILLSSSGKRLAGPETRVPPEVLTRVTHPPQGLGVPQGRATQPVPPPAPQPAPHSQPSATLLPPEPAIFSVQTSDPSLYWAGIRVPVYGDGRVAPKPATLLALSDSMTGHGLFFNTFPFVVIALVIVILSSLLWLPLARSITGPVTHMMKATERIARGRFEVRVDTDRVDEIGRLGNAINEMTARLDAHARGQKRFLGDVAHELASPLARMRLGLGILEEGLEEKAGNRIREVQEEVQQMSDLVDELLHFSRADMSRRKATLQAVNLGPLVQKVVEREDTGSMEVAVAVDDGLLVSANPDLLARALSNVIRNAVRYAVDGGSLRVAATREGERVVLEVRDSGPGVPDEVIPQLFEPFFRPETSRSRDTGGVGLGLAIVKTCVTACRGTVVARNVDGGGFAVSLSLEPAG